MSQPDGAAGVAEDGKLRLYLAHRAALIDTAAPIVGCRSRAEDVVQDAYLKLDDDTPGIRNPLSYMFRLVRNLAIDRARRLSLEKRLGACEEVPENAAAEQPDPEQALLARDTLRHLRAALDTLPPRTRRVFEMRRLEGRSVEEIAAALNLSPRMVYALLADAMTHCREKLFDGEGDRS